MYALFNKSRRISLFSFSSFFLLFALSSTAFAQSTLTPTSTPKSKPVIMADVGIYNSKVVSQNESLLLIGFDIANNANTVQSDIKYGIDVIKKTEKGQTIVDSVVASEVLSLAPHESKSKNLTYIVPPFLSGEYEIWLVSRTTGGMMLGLSTVGTTTFKQTLPYVELVPDSCHIKVENETKTYTLYQGVDIIAEEKLYLSCIIVNYSKESVTYTPTFDTHRRTMYGEQVITPVSTETFTLKGNEKKNVQFIIPKATEPQAYDVSLQLYSTSKIEPLSNKVVAHYVISGGSATIQTVTLDKSFYEKGDLLNAHIFWSPSADGFPDSRIGTGTNIGIATIQMNVVDLNGVSCVEQISKSLIPNQIEYTVQANVITKCLFPQAIFILRDEKGNVLDKRTIESPKQEQSATTTSKTTSINEYLNIFNIVGLLAILGSLIIIFIVIRKHYKRNESGESNNIPPVPSVVIKSIIFMFIVGSSVFGSVGKVEAVTFAGTPFDISLFTTASLSYTVNANKTTYSPGEIIYLSALGSVTHLECSNMSVGMVLLAYLNGSNTTILNATQWGYGTIYSSPTMTAPVNPGNYKIVLHQCRYQDYQLYSSYYSSIGVNSYEEYILYVDPTYGNQCEVANIPITVTAPPISGECSTSINNKYTQAEITALQDSTVNLCSVGSITSSGINLLSKKWTWSCGESVATAKSCEANIVAPSLDVEVKKRTP